jgi:hypothetical protein
MTPPSDSGQPSGDPPPRPEVVQALFSALMDTDPAKLAPLTETGITPAERKQAENLFAAALPASLDYRERTLKAMEVLIGDGKLSSIPTWPDLFDGLTPERAFQLGELYDALPDGARIEYDKRYGQPHDDTA